MAKKTRAKCKEAQTGSGRPKGAGNIERPTAMAVLARCPACASTRYKAQRGAKPVVHEYHGTSRITGDPFQFVVWTNVICEDCGQHFRERKEVNHDPRIRCEDPA